MCVPAGPQPKAPSAEASIGRFTLLMQQAALPPLSAWRVDREEYFTGALAYALMSRDRDVVVDALSPATDRLIGAQVRQVALGGNFVDLLIGVEFNGREVGMALEVKRFETNSNAVWPYFYNNKKQLVPKPWWSALEPLQQQTMLACAGGLLDDLRAWQIDAAYYTRSGRGWRAPFDARFPIEHYWILSPDDVLSSTVSASTLFPGAHSAKDWHVQGYLSFAAAIAGQVAALGLPAPQQACLHPLLSMLYPQH